MQDLYANNEYSSNESIELSKQIGNDKKIISSIENLKQILESYIEVIDSNEEEINETTLLGSLLKVELSMFQETEKIVTADNYSENITNTEKIETILPIENINECVQTEVVTQNPLADSYTVEYNGVKIKNETNYELTEDMMSQRIEVNSNNILIFHTHTCESYTSSEQYQYIPTGNYRTTDTNFTVAKVGNELSKCLTQYGYNVIHDTTYHDYPAYSGSYNRSLNTVEGLLKKQDSDVIIDIHRDAIGSRPDYAPTVKIGEDYAAQLMFVIGTSGGGLWHPNWVQNFQFAIEVQEKANELYPGFFKPMILRNSRYNQHLGKAACIIEVGSTGNTLEQSIISMKYLSKVIDKVLK